MSGPTGEYTGRRHVIFHGVDLTGRALSLEVVADLLAKEVLLQTGDKGANRAIQGGNLKEQKWTNYEEQPDLLVYTVVGPLVHPSGAPHHGAVIAHIARLVVGRHGGRPTATLKYE